jgi:hypothetical protein
LANQRNDRDPVGGLTNYIDVRMCLENGSKTGTDERFVID